jgi:xylulokinase
MAYVIGLDIGTTSTIGIMIEVSGRIMGVVTRPVTLHSAHPGWAEEDPEQWWTNACDIFQELLATTAIKPKDISAIGVTGMLPAVVLLDSGGHVLRRSIQQSDGRCGSQVEAIRSEYDEDLFVSRTGNGINQQLVGTKLRWIEENEPHVFSKIATVFGSYDYINWRLTGVRAIEQNWALEAGFIDLVTDNIAPDLRALAPAPLHAVPPKSASHEVLGKITLEAAGQTGLAFGTPVIGGAADHIASALGAGVVEHGDVLLKFGGSVDVLTATTKVLPDPRMFLDYHLVPGLYVPNGCMSTGGSGLNWFVQTFAGGEVEAARAKGQSIHQYLDGLALRCPAGSDGLTILPYFLGEKTPIHDLAARGVFDGLTFSHGLGHLWRAMLEAYAYAIVHHVEVLKAMGHEPQHFTVSDGGSNSAVWMQIVADVLGEPLQPLKGHPGSCLGAAWTAAVGLELTSDWSGVQQFVQRLPKVIPNSDTQQFYRQGYLRFRDLYTRLSVPPRQVIATGL